MSITPEWDTFSGALVTTWSIRVEVFSVTRVASQQLAVLNYEVNRKHDAV